MTTNHQRDIQWTLTVDSTVCGADQICRADQVHIWRISLCQKLPLPERLWLTLDDAERERATRFYQERDRHAFVIAHAAMRELLGSYSQTSPDAIRFSYDDYGKPQLASRDDSPSLHFSLSHSGDWALLAIAATAVGIDVQQQSCITNLPRMILRICTPAEQDRLQQLVPEQRLAEFFRLWTIKEAVLKAAGCGFQVNPNTLEPVHEQTTEWSTYELSWKGITTNWQAHPFTIDERHRAALALSRDDVEVRAGEWEIQ